MELLLETFFLSQEEFDSYNKKSTNHVKSYFDESMDFKFISHFDYLENLDHNLDEYCEFGADKCHISNFKEFCENLDIDITDNLARIIKEYYYIFENKHSILKRTLTPILYHFYNKNKTFMFTCTSPSFMNGFLAYFGCTGEQKYVIKAFEMIYNDKNFELCYGFRDYV